MLTNNGARLVVISQRSTEFRLITTTAYTEIVVMRPTILCNLLDPVCVIIEVLVIGCCAVGIDERTSVITVFRNVTIFLIAVEICLFHQHGIVIAIQQLSSSGLIRTAQAVRITDTRWTCNTFLCCNVDNTICTTSSPNSRCSAIFQNRDFFNIIGTNTKQRCKLFRISCCKIKIRVDIAFKGNIIQQNQGLIVAIDTSYTANTHLCAASQVTAVSHDIKTCNASLKCVINTSNRNALQLFCIEPLHSSGELPFGNIQASARSHS